MPDPTAATLSLGAAGVVSISALIMLLLQRIKDYFPGLEGWKAMLACDAVSLVVSLLIVYQTTPDWRDPLTSISVCVLTLTFGVTARAFYASLFHVKVEGLPPSSAAVATEVLDTNVETPERAKEQMNTLMKAATTPAKTRTRTR